MNYRVKNRAKNEAIRPKNNEKQYLKACISITESGPTPIIKIIDL